MSILRADVSVVTVVLNNRQGLLRTISSVQEQLGIQIEHVIVDGGSNDGSAEMAHEHSDVTIESRPDGGIYRAMQRGFDASSGQYVIFTNAGDSLFGNSFLGLAFNELTDSGAKWGFGPLIEETQRGTKVWTPVDGEISIPSIAARRTYIPFPAAVIAHDLFVKIGGFGFQYSIAGDFDLIVRLALEQLPIRWDFPIASFEAGGISYTQAPLAWCEERQIRKNNLGLNGFQILMDRAVGVRRVIRWKVGRVLDSIQDKGLLGKVHWRDRKSLPVPERFNLI